MQFAVTILPFRSKFRPEPGLFNIICRASSASKRRPARPGSNSSGALPRRSTSFQSLNQDFYDQDQWRNSDQWLGPYDLASETYSRDNLDFGERQSAYVRTPQPRVLEQKQRPYSANVATSRGQQLQKLLQNQQRQQQQQQQQQQLQQQQQQLQQQQLMRQKSNLLNRSSSQAQSDFNSKNNRTNGR